MSKSQTNLSLPISTIEAMRERAGRVGVSVSDLSDLFMRRGLDTVSDEALLKWAKGLQNRMGRLAGAMTKNERVVIAALEALKAREKGAWRFGLDQVANAAGLPLKAAFWALQALVRREFAAGMDVDKSLDRWGRPVESLWWLIGADSQMPKPLNSAEP